MVFKMSAELKVSLPSRTTYIKIKIYTVEDQIHAEYIWVVKTGSSESVIAGPLVDGLDKWGIRFRGMNEKV